MFIEFREDGFWAYDVAVSILLKHMIDRAQLREPCDWLLECLERWRINTLVSDFGMHLDPAWTLDQCVLVQTVISEAIQELKKVESISADEAAAWRVHDESGICFRGHKQILSAPIITLGQAITNLLQGALPKPPPGTWWFYGISEGTETIRMRT